MLKFCHTSCWHNTSIQYALINSMMLGQNMLYKLSVYNVLYLYISAPLSEARCSKNSDKGILYVRHRSKAYIRVCIAPKAASVLLLARLLSRVLRASKLLPKVVICINIIRYTLIIKLACFAPNIIAFRYCHVHFIVLM